MIYHNDRCLLICLPYIFPFCLVCYILMHVCFSLYVQVIVDNVYLHASYASYAPCMVKTLSGTNSSQMKKSPSFLFFFTIQNAGNFPASYVSLPIFGWSICLFHGASRGRFFWYKIRIDPRPHPSRPSRRWDGLFCRLTLERSLPKR